MERDMPTLDSAPEKTTLTAIIERAEALGVRARRWERNGKVRLYAQTDPDISVWLEIKGDENDISDASFEAFNRGERKSADIPRSFLFRYGQCEREKERVIGLWHAFVLEHYPKADNPTAWQQKNLDAAKEWLIGRRHRK